ncbi:hypothetical protein F4810DRAFT_714314 [Camillea tinctor]|nr:hypothetical protein F4810DRAFT_714314 [Camillea tinctor]
MSSLPPRSSLAPSPSPSLPPYAPPTTVRHLSPTRILKTGPSVHPSEAALLQHIGDTTSVPVPRIHSCVRNPATGYWEIQMSRVDVHPEGGLEKGGKETEVHPLEAVYANLGPPARDALARQLAGYVWQMRRCRADWIGSFDGGKARDRKFLSLVAGEEGEGERRRGLYGSEEEFLRDVADAVRRRGAYRSAWSLMVGRMLMDLPQQRRWLRICGEIEALLSSVSGGEGGRGYSGGCAYREDKGKGKFVLTHADLTPEHILVRYDWDEDTVEIVGIVGWGQAGFYPEWYEYVKMNLWDPDSAFMEDRIPDRVLEPWLPELSAFLHAKDIVW